MYLYTRVPPPKNVINSGKYRLYNELIARVLQKIGEGTIGELTVFKKTVGDGADVMYTFSDRLFHSGTVTMTTYI